MNLYLVRHGQTKGNSESRYIGSFEDELSKEGIEQIKKSKKLIDQVSFDKVFSSRKKRAVDSGKLLTEQEIILDQRLNEIDFGIFENMTYKEICKRYPLEQKAWEEDWIGYKIPKGESVIEAYDRVARFMRFLEKQSYKNSLVITHGGIIRLVYCYILGGDYNKFWKFASRNGNISILKFQNHNWYIDSIIQLDSIGSE